MLPRIAISLLVASACLGAVARAGEIDFVEEFALAPDRSVPLRQLIPGTENYYYYHAMHYQHTEQFDKVDELLRLWVARYGHTARELEIENRQALLQYGKNPQPALDLIARRLQLQFNHQRELLNAKPNLPTALAPQLLARETLTQIALQHYSNLQGFEDSALDWLVKQPLDADRRRHLISRLTRPDHADLVKLVLADIAHPHSGGFGSLPLHRQLLRAQLDELLAAKPEFLHQANFVTTYLTKLVPQEDVEWRADAQEYTAYLDRLWEFVARTPPAFNSLKAHVLYHRLAHDRSQGVYDKDRFLAYIQLPRPQGYMAPKFLALDDSRRWPCDLNADYFAFTQLPPVGNDEPLVRAFLHHFFVTAATWQPYDTWLNDVYLKQQFAETKLVNGLGNAEQWYSLLSPESLQALKERIDIDFAPTNSKYFRAGEPVSLDLHLKNVSSLLVKVYEINALNFYRQNGIEVDTNINLDGLVANKETTYALQEPALRRIAKHFEFPELAAPGVYVIDFIGAGRSSRALIRKGRLHHLVRTTAAGQAFTVYDESNRKLPQARVWLGGREYGPDKNGNILVPFSTNPGSQKLVLVHEGLASLDSFTHEGENYDLRAGIFVDRESLVAGRKAKLVIRPALYVNAEQVSLKLLENVRLQLAITDHDGVASQKEIPDFALLEDREAEYEFQVPPRLASLRVTLAAQVQNVSRNNKQDLASGHTFSLNGIDRTDHLEDLHLSRLAAGYVLDLFGRSGEPLAERPVTLQIKHRDFVQPVSLSLQTDEAGRLVLGPLAEIAWVKAASPFGQEHVWNLPRDHHTQGALVQGQAGETVVIPYTGRATKPERWAFSLLDLRGNTFAADHFEALSLAPGLLSLNKLPPGNYSLWLKETNEHIRVQLAAGETQGQYVLGTHRKLEVRSPRPLHIASLTADKDAVVVKLAHATKFARVHVFATRYEPDHGAFSLLSVPREALPGMRSVPRQTSSYIEGRNIGDEYRYILDRRFAQKFPGNMLERPGLLLNPWAVQKTETSQQMALEGSDFGAAGGSDGAESKPAPEAARPTAEGGGHANLNYLQRGTVVLLNLLPNEQGEVRIPRADLAGKHYVHVVAVDPLVTSSRSLALEASVNQHQDLRLLAGLDPAKHFTQQQQVSLLAAGDKLTIDDITSSRFETYDSVARLYRYYLTLNNDSKLAEFGFITTWHQQKPEEKRTLYSKYACHELNFFLARRDPEFFQAVVQPYLANKKDPTFLDHWLLGHNLAERLAPWNYGQLNTAERILLSQRLAGEPEFTARHIGEAVALLPPNSDREQHLFRTALYGSALETSNAESLKMMVTNGAVQIEALHLEKLADAAGTAGRASGGAAASGPRGAAAAKPAAPPAPTIAPADRADSSLEIAGELQNKAKKLDDYRSRSYRQNEEAKRRAEEAPAEDEAALAKETDDAMYFYDAQAERRKQMRRFFQKLDQTEEFAENNYYKLAVAEQSPDLVGPSPFWHDFARHAGEKPFRSAKLAEASRNFTEAMFALAVVDLPFEAGKHATAFEGARYTLTAAGPVVAFHEEIRPCEPVPGTSILVSQNFFRNSDRYREENGERFDKFVTEEFLTHVVYGCQVVLTNPTSSRKKVDVLLQLPLGSLPLANGQATRSVKLDLQPYHTQTIEYFFYFPAAGQFAHYPVHVSQGEKLLAFAAPFTFRVVREPTHIDRGSWDYVSQHGTNEEVLAFLKSQNVQRLNLERIAFRMQDKAFFQQTLGLLAQRHVYHHVLWSYAVRHNVSAGVREFLQHAPDFVNQCGAFLESPLLTIDPVARKAYEHLEYSPLVNARAHPLGQRRQILNDRFHAQYHRLLNVLAYRRQFDAHDNLAVTYYLLLQDRTAEAQTFFARVNAQQVNAKLQYDYLAAYLDLFAEKPAVARAIANRYANYPVDRWRKLFLAVGHQLDEIEGKPGQLANAEERGQVQTQLASSEPSFDLAVEARKVTLNYQNLTQVRVNYYLMDVELLFSRNPLVQQFSGQFSYIRPNGTQTLVLPEKENKLTFDLPEQLHNSNVLVEVVGAGQAKTQAYYANSLVVQVVENYGQVHVAGLADNRPVPKAYVKVYAQMQNGQTRFFKDGYTDLRGRFDYASLSTNELEFVKSFSILVLSDEHGAVVRAANPPKR